MTQARRSTQHQRLALAAVVDFLTNSILLSVALTIVLNLALWARRQRSTKDSFGGIAPSRHASPEFDRSRTDDESTLQPPESGDAWLGDSTGTSEPHRGQRPRVQVFFPWKAMLIGSIGLTVLLNVLNARG